MQSETDKQQRFLEMLEDNKSIIAKICCIYSSPGADFDDLYQETVINLWNGFDRFRGEAKVSTWIYRAAINTCITWHRRNDRHSRDTVAIDTSLPIIDEESSKLSDYNRLHSLISQLAPLEKAIITLWLDEKSYDEIALITGLTKQNVAVRLHRIKEKMAKMPSNN